MTSAAPGGATPTGQPTGMNPDRGATNPQQRSAIGAAGGASTPAQAPTVSATNVPLGRDLDAFTAGKETSVSGTNQDRGQTSGDYDTSERQTIRDNIANSPGSRPFTGNP
jgi:hypothetical protein